MNIKTSVLQISTLLLYYCKLFNRYFFENVDASKSKFERVVYEFFNFVYQQLNKSLIMGFEDMM